MEGLEGRVVLESTVKQREMERLRQRNRVAKRASRARQRQREQGTDPAECSASLVSQDEVPPPPADPGRPPTLGSENPDESPAGAPAVGETSATPAPQATAEPPIFWDANTLDGTLDGTFDEEWSEFCCASPLNDAHAQDDQQMCLSRLCLCHPLPPTPAASINWPRPQPPVEYPSHSAAEASKHKPPGHDEGTTSSGAAPGDLGGQKSSRLLHIAVRNGTSGILLSLIKAGADVNSRDASGTSPIHLAIRFRRVNVLEALIKHGADVNARDSANMTALEIAVRAQDEELVNVLLSGGAELH